MSLFKAREWWSTVAGEEEEFDQGCMCVGNVDNSSSGSHKIVVGSYHGYLRVYNPRPEKTESGWTGFRAEDVMCETSLQLPILQVEIGKFISGSENDHLAVLHPRKLSVYTLVGTSGAVEHGTQYQLKLAYEHNLQRTACNFCYGPFGGVKGRDFLCVQSMDGTLSVFEQESFAFSRFLPAALLPGPLKYVMRTDSFITVSSSRQVESYKYQVLAVATDVKSREESQNLKSGKRVVADWTFNIGEQAVDLQVTEYTNGSLVLYILGERNLYALSELGKLQFMKKFDFNPSCFTVYRAVNETEAQCVVGTHTNTLLIYQNITLHWAAQTTYLPIQVCVADFQDLRGVIVTLDEDGHLSCSYLGTDPAMFTTPTAEVREIDYSDLDKEMKQLQKVIKEQSSKSMPLVVSTSSEDDLQMFVSVPPNLDEPSLAADVDLQDEETIPSITVKISLKAKTILNNVTVSVHVVSPLAVNENLVSFPSLEPNHAGETQLTFFMKRGVLPADLKADLTASYESSMGAPRIVSASIRLPLKLVCKPVLPVKTANYKITIDTNKAPVNLNDIFPELLGENAGAPGNALGFAYYGMSPIVTLLASQKSQRYRLQSDDFSSMWPILNELVQRLNSYFRAGRPSSDFKISYEGPLPLQEYFDVLDGHFEGRQNADRYSKLLEERAAQFRAIQRRLLTRFKDKTPAPLANLDTLLDGTYRQILALAEAMEDNRQTLEGCGAALSCATRIINLLITLWLSLPPEHLAVLEATLLPAVTDNGTQGWEETVDASVTHLLRTTLAKSAKDQTVNPSPLTLLKDTTKLKKHIALLFDRLSKGGKLVIEGVKPVVASQSSPSPKPTSKPPLNSSDTSKRRTKKLTTTLDTLPEHRSAEPDLGQADVPVGSQFGSRAGTKTENESDATDDLPDVGNLPPVGGGRSGSDFLKKKGKSAVDDIPDLDDMSGDTEADNSLFNGRGGGNELVYGL